MRSEHELALRTRHDVEPEEDGLRLAASARATCAQQTATITCCAHSERAGRRCAERGALCCRCDSTASTMSRNGAPHACSEPVARALNQPSQLSVPEGERQGRGSLTHMGDEGGGRPHRVGAVCACGHEVASVGPLRSRRQRHDHLEAHVRRRLACVRRKKKVVGRRKKTAVRSSACCVLSCDISPSSCSLCSATNARSAQSATPKVTGMAGSSAAGASPGVSSRRSPGKSDFFPSPPASRTRAGEYTEAEPAFSRGADSLAATAGPDTRIAATAADASAVALTGEAAFMMATGEATESSAESK